MGRNPIHLSSQVKQIYNENTTKMLLTRDQTERHTFKIQLGSSLSTPRKIKLKEEITMFQTKMLIFWLIMSFDITQISSTQLERVKELLQLQISELLTQPHFEEVRLEALLLLTFTRQAIRSTMKRQPALKTLSKPQDLSGLIPKKPTHLKEEITKLSITQL